MSLPSPSSKKYLDRFRFFVDSDVRKDADGANMYNARYDLGREIQNIVSATLVGYNIPRDILPTFVEETRLPSGEIIPGNNMLDITVTDFPVTTSFTFSFAFPVGRFSVTSQNSGPFYYQNNDYPFVESMVDLLNARLYSFSHPTFNSANGYAFEYRESVAGPLLKPPYLTRMWWVNFLKSGDPLAATSTYLFGTGENKANSAWKVLGFEEGVDTGGPGITLPGSYEYDPVPIRELLLSPFQYVDVLLDAGEIKNAFIGRVTFGTRTFSDIGYSQYNLRTAGTTNGITFTNRHPQPEKYAISNETPPRKISEVGVKLRFEDNIQIPTELIKPFDLIIDFLFLSTEIDVPKWVQQVLAF